MDILAKWLYVFKKPSKGKPPECFNNKQYNCKMKTIFAAVSLFLFFSPNYLHTQTFSFIRTSLPVVSGSTTDTVIVSYAKIINMTNSPINIRLHRDSVHVPYGWLTAICEPNTCYGKPVDSTNGYNYPPGETQIQMKFYPDPHHNAIAYMHVRAHLTSGTSEHYEQTFGAIIGPIGVKQISSLVEGFQLNQNYPNPFNPTTKIAFSIPKSEIVIVKVYDNAGREIEELLNQYLSSGKYELEFKADMLSSGVYYYKIETPQNIAVKKMVLIK